MDFRRSVLLTTEDLEKINVWNYTDKMQKFQVVFVSILQIFHPTLYSYLKSYANKEVTLILLHAWFL